MLPCGHNEATMYRYRHRGITMKYCLGCIVEKHPEANIDDMYKKLRKKAEKKEKIIETPPVNVKKKKETIVDENK
jgi:hypothetical protein